MGIQIAMVAFPSPPCLPGTSLIEDFAQRWANVPAPAEVDARADMLAFRAGEWDAVLMVMPAPIPWSELEGPCATSILWPHAGDALKSHGSHVIVTVPATCWSTAP